MNPTPAPEWSRADIDAAWAWHRWAPRWLRGPFRNAAKRWGLRRYAGLGVCGLDTGQRLLVSLDDMIECNIAVAGEWEGQIYQAVRPLVRPGAVALDIGGHVGYSAVLMADWVGPAGRLHVFEPVEANAARSEANLALNGLAERALVHRLAVSDREGTANFQTSHNLNTGMGAISATGGLKVRTVALDDWLDAAGIAEVALAKIDIEGAEAPALAGMARGLAAGRYRAILVEVHHDLLPNFGSSTKAIAETFRAAGYALHPWLDAGGFADGPLTREHYCALALAPGVAKPQ